MGIIIGMMEAGWSARLLARQIGRFECAVRRCSEQWIRIYTKTRLRTPSTDQSSRRPPHCKKCTRTANCFISRHPGTGSIFNRGPCVFSNHSKGPGRRTLGSRCLLCVLPLTPTHLRLSLEWCHTRGKWTAAEWSQVVFSDESRFNLRSDDNRVRVGRPRGERLNPAFALQRHTCDESIRNFITNLLSRPF
ncbi:uncharacterized protein TNCV_4481001 [Trichonephila clavipes]|nr:uncharacterized protein TNCV_4481001 [Trichonephila clavipes]